MISRWLAPLGMLFALATGLRAHPVSFNSTITYSATQPAGGAESVANWTGAAFDAANIGGSGVNADGGADNGAANDASTYVANNQPRQGQTITTGSNANGYDVTSVTVRMAGYTNNTATGSNGTAWNLNAMNGPIQVEIGKVNGTEFTTFTKQLFIAGATGNPGSGQTANGPGSYFTFVLPFATHLEPNTTYGFDFWIGNGSSNYFEWLGTSTDPYSGGTAYTRAWWGGPITALTGERVFMVNMTASASAPAAFAHPGTLHTQADLARMAAKVAANAQPWKSDYDQLAASPYAQTWWPSYNVDYINRGGANPNNYTRSQQDAQAIYELALRWHITGNTAYADRAVQIANVWNDLIGVTGDTNGSLAAGICGYLFAIGGDLLSTYPGWAAADKQAYKDMMMRVFYPANLDFLWRHHGTPESKGGNTHYRLNWDTCNMASMAAIGVLCDNRAVYEQAVGFFKYGAGNGRIERAAWMVHPNGLAQGEEVGRDQAHNQGGWYSMGLLCQTAWNQGDDLFAYDNNRALRAWEYNAKYNLGNPVPYTAHRNASLTYTEASVWGAPGLGYLVNELVFQHYANIKGIAAPYCKLAAEARRPEGYPHVEYHPSAVDWLGLAALTHTRDPIAAGAVPSGLVAHWTKNKVTLNWWGSTYATSYNIKRASVSGGPYTPIGTAGDLDTTFTDTSVANGGTYFYVVSANTPGGETANSTELAMTQSLVTRYTFENTLDDLVGTRHGAAMGGSTGAPGFAAGNSGQAVSLDGVDDFVQLPVGSGNYQDITIAAWVYWNGGNAWQRVFDFGSEIEKYMMLTVNAGSNLLRFQMTTTRTTDGTLTITGPALPTATWTHVAITLNGDTATMYVNGVPVASAVAAVDPLFGQPYCYLGKSMWNADPLFSGRIDDFRIYNYALSGSDVYAVWGQSANSAPTFTSDPITKTNANEDAAYTGQTLASDATDVNGGTLTFSKISGPSWLSVASNGGLTGTPTNSDVGENLFVVRVTDTSGATDDANLTITVNNVNDAPVWSANPITKRVVTRDQPYDGVTLAGDASDVDVGDALTFSKVSGPAWLSVAADGTLSGTPGVSDVGANGFTVRVTDLASAFTNATLNITVLPFMLRSQYAFEGNANDSVSALNGVATGSPAYAAGRFAQAITFDAVDDVVTLPADVASYRDITIATFVWWNGGNTWQRIFDFGNNTSQYLSLTPNSPGGIRFEIANGGVYQQIYAPTLTTGRWVHVAVTLSGDTGTLYVDGTAVAANTAMTINPDDFRPSVNYLGDSQYSADPLFNGKLDDVRIYNYALAAADVFDIANPIPEVPSGLATTGLQAKVVLSWNHAQAVQTYTVKRSLTSGGSYSIIASGLTTESYTDTGLTNGVTYFYVVSATNAKGESANSAEIAGTPSDLLVHLKFNETTGATAADSSGNGYDAALLGGPTFSAGQLGNAVDFASASSQSATLPTGVVSTLDDFTITAWVKVASFATWARVFDFGTGTNNYMVLAPQYTGTAPDNAKFRFAIRTAAVGEQQLNSSVAITAGTWNHVAVTLSGSTGTLYLNGTAVATNTGMTLTPSSLGTTTQNFLADSQWSPDPLFDGALDDFRIYSRALSPAEISVFQTLLTAPQNLATTPGPEQVALAWDAVPNASSYLVRTSTTSGGPYTTLGSVTGTTLTHTGLPMIPRYYVVAAQNFTGTGADSAEAGATPESPAFTAAELRGGTFAFISGGTAMTMTMPASVVGHTYQLQYCADLATGQWDDVGTAEPGTGNDIVFSIPFAPGNQGFFRFLITR